MNRFGYTIRKDNQIDYDRNDRSIAQYIQRNESTFRICINCGSCSATCTAANYTRFSFRKLCLLIRRGEMDEVRSEVSKCILCGKCRLVCPRGVNTRNIILLVHHALHKQKVYEQL